MIRLWGNSKRYMKLETEKTYITHIKSLKGEGWVEAERKRGKRGEKERKRERERERGTMEVALLEWYK